MEIFKQNMSYKQFIKYLIPSVLSMLFLSFYTTIDGYFVSIYAGSNALAGINIVVPITCIIFGTSVMLATGSGAIIGDYMGQNKLHDASVVFSLLSLVLFILSLTFTIFGLIFLKPIALFLGSSDLLLEYVLPYLFVIFLSSIPMSFKLFFEYLVRTDGKPKVGLKMSFIGIVLNIIFDYLFVGIFNLGTLGAALGTLISITFSCLMGLIYFIKYSNLYFCKPIFNFKILFKSCSNGLSEMLTELSTGITTLLFNIIIINIYGEDGVAAVTIIMYIYYFFISFYMGIAVSSAPIISYNLGAKNAFQIEKILKYSFITIIITAIIIYLTLFIGSDYIIHLFVDNGPVFDLTAHALIYFNPLFLFIGINIFMSSYFTAINDGFNSALISSFRSFILVILFIIILPKIIGTNGIWLTMPLSELITLFISIILYKNKGNIFSLIK